MSQLSSKHLLFAVSLLPSRRAGAARGRGVGAGLWRRVKGGGDREQAAQPSQGCWFPAGRQHSIRNADRRCCRWRSGRQRSRYEAVRKPALIFHQHHVYARKQTKKEVCRLNLPCSLSVTHTHVCSPLLIFSPPPPPPRLELHFVFFGSCSCQSIRECSPGPYGPF